MFDKFKECSKFYIDFYFPQKNGGFWSRLQTPLDTKEEALEKMEELDIDRATNKRVVKVYERTSLEKT